MGSEREKYEQHIDVLAEDKRRLQAEIERLKEGCLKLADRCVDGQNELHGLKHGRPAKSTLTRIESQLRKLGGE